MKTLHFYLLRQVIAALLMTVVVFTFVLLLGNVLREVLGLLVNRQASLLVVVQAVALLIPFVWVFALPMGMLTATLLVFGRFSADQELTAARAGGISLISLTTPILLLSLLLSGLSAWVNMELGPRSRESFKGLIFKYTADLSSAQLPEGRYIRDFPGFLFYVGKNRDRELEDVVVYQLNTGANLPNTFIAPRGRLDVDITNRLITLHLFEAKGVVFQGDHALTTDSDVTYELPLDGLDRARKRTSISDMSFLQLRAELRELEKQLAVPLTLSTNQDANVRRQEIANQLKDPTSRARVQMHRQVAFSFACFGFTLIGIPLGIRMHRRETNIGFAIAIVLVLVYYSFIMLALSLDQHPEWMPHLILWLPNLIFQVVGAVLLWRANRGL